MKFGIVGNNDGPLYLLEALKDSSTQPEFIGLQKEAQPELKKAYQQTLNRTDYFENFDEKKLLKQLQDYELDLLINCFCNFKFIEILDLPFSVFNVHLSPLPAYRGRHPLQWALINGETEFGISIHKMTERYDAGGIYWQRHTPVKEGISIQTLRTQLLNELKSGFAEFMDNLGKDKIEPISNDDQAASYAPRRYPQDSKLTEWHSSATVYRKVQALRSEDYPAFFILGNQKIECIEAEKGSEHDQHPEKPFISDIQRNRFHVICTDGQSVWLKCLPEQQQYLSLNQTIS